MSAIYLLLLFVLYSVLGWIIDSLARSVTDHKWSPGGFSPLPFCPTYGVGALLLVFLSPLLIPYGYVAEWATYSITLALLEYVSGLVMVHLWHRRLWEYVGWPRALGGHTDAIHAAFWGLLGLYVVHEVHPAISTLLLSLGIS